MIGRWRRGGLGLAAALVALLVLTAGAVAYWTTTGSGAASATSSTTLPVVVSAGVPTGQLYPGASADVAVVVSNPNAFGVRLGSLSLDATQGTGGFEVDAPHASCGLAALSFTSQNNGASGWTIPPKVGAANGSLAIDLTGAIAMATGAADGCQGASFVVHLSVGAS